MDDIQPEELIQRLEAREVIKVIDVRETWEYEEANIGMENIPFYELPFHLHELAQYKETELIVHCTAGNKSVQAKLYLEHQGFKKVRSLATGMEGYILQKGG